MYFPHLLTLLFIALKLTEVITWSWWLVVLPSLFSIGIALVCWLVVIGGIVYVSLKS